MRNVTHLKDPSDISGFFCSLSNDWKVCDDVKARKMGFVNYAEYDSEDESRLIYIDASSLRDEGIHDEAKRMFGMWREFSSEVAKLKGELRGIGFGVDVELKGDEEE